MIHTSYYFLNIFNQLKHLTEGDLVGLRTLIVIVVKYINLDQFFLNCDLFYFKTDQNKSGVIYLRPIYTSERIRKLSTEEKWYLEKAVSIYK